jgi:hypothetical protein
MKLEIKRGNNEGDEYLKVLLDNEEMKRIVASRMITKSDSEVNNGLFSENNVKIRFGDLWFEKYYTNSLSLKYGARDKIISQIKERIQDIENWKNENLNQHEVITINI